MRKQLSNVISVFMLTAAMQGPALGDEPRAAVPTAMSDFNMPAQPLADALRAVATETQTSVLFDAAAMVGRKAPALKARVTVDEALTRLLVGSGLTHRRLNEKTIVLAPADRQSNKPVPAASGMQEVEAGQDALRVAQSEPARSGVERNTQEKEDGEATSDSSAGEMVVTGSHIRGAATTQPSISITREEILRRGFSSFEDVLRSLPMNYSSVNSSSFVDGSAPRFSDGMAAVNLRGLGTGATLILVDGRRTANAPTENDTMVDINKFPIGMIERIDIITGGASAVYGGDAVAGVINIITRKDYQGAETFVRFEDSSTRADGHEIRQLLGFGWASGNLTASLNYQKENPAESVALGINTLDQRGRGGRDFRNYTFTTPGQISNGGPGMGIPGAPAGTRIALLPAGDGRNLSVNDLTYISSLDYTLQTGNYNLLVPADTGIEKYLTPENKNKGANVVLTQHLTDTLDLSLNASYFKRESVTESNQSVITEIVPASNAYNPFGQPVQVSYTLVNEINSGRMPGPVTASKSDSVGGGGELALKLPWRNWRSTLGFNLERARNDSYSTSLPSVYFDQGQAEASAAYAAYVAALNSSDPAQALNLLGNGTGHGVGVDFSRFIYKDGNGEQISKLRSATLSFAGSAGLWSGRSVETAVGIELRRESLDYSDFRLNVFDVQPVRDLQAAFGELSIPLPHAITIQAVGRYDRYEIEGPFGSSGGLETRTFEQFSPQVGARWQATGELQIKLNWSQAFQAPTIQDLFNPAFGFGYSFYDPINPASNGGPGFVPAIFGGGGNPNLQPQTSDSYTLELNYRPAFMDGLSTVVAFSRIEVTDVVRSGIGNISSFLELLENSDQHPGVIRDANGVLQGIYFQPINAASLESEAIDLRLDYDFETEWGSFSAGAMATYTLKLSDQLTPATPVVSYEGTSSGPSNWKIIPHLLWNRGPWSGNVFVNYDAGVRNFSDISPQRHVNSLTTVDTQLGYDVNSRGWRFTVGARNLLDTHAAFYDSAHGLDFSRYDTRGRQIYVDVVKTFSR